ncbi:hypothetical protein Tco_0588877 [Tanacetum coccineum]
MSDPTSKPSNALPVKIKAPKELPKISLVNESLKKLKFHLSKFDNVMKIRTTPNARIEGEWGFEHTKAVFNNEIIPFLKSLKDIFTVFDRDLLDEIMEVKTVFDQMDTVVQHSSVDKQCLEIAKKEILFKNDRLLQQIMSQKVLLTVMNSMSLIGKSVNMDGKRKESYDLEVFKEQFDSIKKTRVRNKEQSDSLIDKLNLKSAEYEDLKAQILDKVFVITSMKNNLQKLKLKEIVDIAEQIPSATTIVPGMFKLDLEPLAPRLKCSTSKSGSKPTNNKKNDRISQTPSRNMKNKVEAKPRNINKKNCVVKPVNDDDVKHSLLNANFELICATCKKSLFDGVHDICFLDYVKIGKAC